MASRKILRLEEAAARVRADQAANRTVVHCHGCFDIVHPGHVRHLQHAATLGDRLLVTLTADSHVAKGDGRPLFPQELRAENLAALDCVDWVAINSAPTASELLEAIRPDVYVKGAEYEHNNDPRFQLERQVVEQHGGRVVFTSGDVVFSSTALIAALEHGGNPFQASLTRLLMAHDVTPDSMDVLIEGFAGKRVLVIGEVIRDTYVMCDRPAVAGEGPIMTLHPVEYRTFDGGAAIIARHLAAMGARPSLLTALPRSPEAEAIRQRLGIEGVQSHWVDVDQPIYEKQRFLVGSAKVMKVDLGQPITLAAALQRELVSRATELARECDAVIIADYGLGLLSATLITSLCSAVRPLVSVMAGDVSGRRSNLLAMRGMDLLCPSESEIRDALHDYDEGLNAVVWRVLDATQSSAALATLGEEGLLAFTRLPDAGLNPGDWRSRLDAQHVPAFAPFAVDQLGCGDSLLASATLALCAGASVPVAGLIGSVAAACEARRLGNAVIGAADLRRGVRSLCDSQLTYEPKPAAMSAMAK